jgi:hypothetical protein
MTELAEYETPRAQVRGVFLCENVAVGAVSVLAWGIDQDDWTDSVEESIGGGTDLDGDIGVMF